jgi:Flp pilus assembly protein TadD
MSAASKPSEILYDAKGQPYTPAVSAPLRKLLWTIFGAVAVLGATGVYLGAVTFLEFATGQVYQTVAYYWVFLLHLALGLLMVLPFVAFGALHMRTGLKRPNRKAVRAGLALFTAGCLVMASGIVLMKRDLGEPWNGIAYWTHVLGPIAALLLYLYHRLLGPALAWRWGAAWGASVALIVGAMVLLHSQDPRRWNQVGPKEGEKYFQPSLARTSTGNFIPMDVLMMDEYCLKCHPDTYDNWFHSAHRFSSFNNAAYRFSVRETRQVAYARDGNTQAARFCAGCHDPVPFFSGRFDNPDYDDLSDPTAHAGITCTVCHAITHVNGPRGNSDYTIEEPQHYPFAFSEHPVLSSINNQLVKAKPALHKKTFLKPLHKTAEFCSTCHKVHLPYELNHYKEFLRGQNHYDSYLLSGVSGHGAQSFYYPPKAFENCSEGCHMPLLDSRDFGHRDGKVHSHLFPGANTGLAELRGHEPTRRAQEDFLRDQQMRIDIFGLRKDASLEGELLAPLRPSLPELEPGKEYLLEVVLRTLRLGHHFTQGTVDSNEVWVEVEARSGSRFIGRSGAIDGEGSVDEWSHFVNVLMLDRAGRRIDRRNAQDIFVPLYNHQIPPGAGQAVHYRLKVPEGVEAPVEIAARLLYRKFDRTYMEHVFGENDAPNLKPVVLCEDRVVLPVAGMPPSSAAAMKEQRCEIPEWQRWNDYGIGLLIKGEEGAEKGALRQAEEVFKKVAELGRADGWVNLARVYDKEGRLDDAVEALDRALKHPEPAPAWTVSWLTGNVNRQNGRLDEAIRNYEAVLATRVPERGFDFSFDYRVRNDLGLALLERALTADGEERARFLARAREEYRKTLAIDPENATAHYNLMRVHRLLGEPEAAKEHHRLFDRYRVDDNARETAIRVYREANPAANHAAQSIVIYDLKS